MQTVFICYARVDRFQVIQIVEILERAGLDAWFDYRLLPGQDWQAILLDAITACDAFIYVLSPESIASEWCQWEFAHAVELGKPIVPVCVQTNINPPPAIQRYHWADFSQGVTALSAVELIGGLNRAFVVPQSDKPNAPSQPRDLPAQAEITGTHPSESVAQSTKGRGRGVWISAAVAILLVLAVLVVGLMQVLGNDNDKATPTHQANVASATLTMKATMQVVADDPTSTETPSLTTSLSETPTVTATPTETPLPTLSAAQGQQTIDAMIAQMQGLDTQVAASAATETALAPLTIEAGTAQALTQTATLWTPVPTPNYQQTAERGATQTREVIATQVEVDRTLTATLWTDTPTFTYTPSNTLTLTSTATSTPTSTPTLMIDLEVMALQKAEQGVSGNGQWIPFIKEFDGVEMVLVPVGCFRMGATVNDIEQPVRKVCFEQPFWIDRYEVTNAQFKMLVGQAQHDSYWVNDTLPREQITWFEARDFCIQRGARLPTEAEWEYAARGPDGLVYPWGDVFVAGNVVYVGNSGNYSSIVGSRPDGASWVGALDMLGNVWEWTSTLYADYPYDRADGREGIRGSNSLGVLRGGAWNSFSSNLRASYRYKLISINFSAFIGFRCARSQ